MSVDTGDDFLQEQRDDEQPGFLPELMDVENRFQNVNNIKPAFLLPTPEKKPEPILVTPSKPEASQAATAEGSQKPAPKPPLSEEDKKKKIADYLRRKKERVAKSSPLVPKKPASRRS